MSSRTVSRSRRSTGAHKRLGVTKMGRTRIVMGAVVAALALAAVAEAALTESYQYKRTAQDDAKAGAMVLQRSDLPPALKSLKGGRVKPDETPETSKDRCGSGDLPKESDLVVTGDAESHFFNGVGDIDTQVTLFKTSSMATVDWNRQIPTFTPSCIRQVMANELGAGSRVGTVTRLGAIVGREKNASLMFEVTYTHPGKPNVKYVFVVTELRLGRTEASVLSSIREVDANAKTVALQLQEVALKSVQSRFSSK